MHVLRSYVKHIPLQNLIWLDLFYTACYHNKKKDSTDERLSVWLWVIKITAKFADRAVIFMYKNYFFLNNVTIATIRMQNWIRSAQVTYIQAFILSYSFHSKTSFSWKFLEYLFQRYRQPSTVYDTVFHRWYFNTDIFLKQIIGILLFQKNK